MRVIAESKTSSQRGISDWLAAWMLCALLCTPGLGQSVDAYVASAIWTGDGDPIQNGVLLVRDGVIVAVGRQDQIEIPPRTKRHELGSATLIPGLVIAQTNIVESTRAEDYAISPEVRAVDGFDPFADYKSLLAAGITTVQISPGGNRLMSGVGGVVKLAGEDPTRQILAEVESLRITLTREGLSPPTVYEPPLGAVSVERPVEPTKPQLGTSLAQAIVGLEALLTEASEADSPDDVRLASDVRLRSLAQIIQGKRVSRWTAGSNAEILAALNLARKFDLPWIVVDPLEVDMLSAKEVWESDLARGVILNPEIRPGRISNPIVPREGAKPEMPVWQRARSLIDAGAADRLALRASTDQDLKTLLFSASVLGRGGLTPAEILRTITSNPARILGVADRVGSLKTNADADFVVLSGAPFEPGTKVLATFTEGRSVFDIETKHAHTKVIHAAKIYTSRGVLESSSVAVVGGKIAALGTGVSLPQGAQVRDFGNAVIIPGMIDCSTSLGLGGSLSETTSFSTKLGPLLARDDDQVALGRQGGVTTALLSSTRLPSPVLAFKLTDSPRPLKDPVALRFEIKGNLTATESSLERTLKTGKDYADSWNKYDTAYAEYKKQLAKYEVEKGQYDAAMKTAADKKTAEAKKADEEKKQQAAAKENTKDDEKPSDKEDRDNKENDTSEGSNSDQATEQSEPAKEAVQETSGVKVDAAKTEAKTDGKEADKPDPPKLVEPKKPAEPSKPRLTASLEAYRDLFAKKIVAMVDVSDVKAVELAVKLFRKDFGLRTAIVAGEATAKRLQLLADNDVFVVVGPAFVGTDDAGELLNYAAELSIAGVPIGFQSSATTGVSELPAAISYAVYEGLGNSDALQGLTAGTAKFFGLESVGILEVGKDADLVVLSGPPLLLSTEVMAVMIDGEWVYEKESN